MEKIAILMSTYNGENYLVEQIESILNQNIDLKLYNLAIYIRDDGSIDSTHRIIKEYVHKYSDRIFLVDEETENIGVRKSFVKLAQIVDAEYYFFADQDDVWLPDKVIKMINILKFYKFRSAGVYSDLWIADENAKSTGSFMKHETKNTKKVLYNKGKVDYRQLLFTYLVTGASFAFNNTFKKKYIDKIKLDDIGNVQMHDSYLALLLALEDNLMYIDEPLVYYRQHGNNVVGAVNNNKKSIWDYIRNIREPINNRLQLLKDARLAAIAVSHNENTQILEEFITIFSGRNYLKRWTEINKYQRFLTVSPSIAEKLMYTFFVKL